MGYLVWLIYWFLSIYRKLTVFYMWCNPYFGLIFGLIFLITDKDSYSSYFNSWSIFFYKIQMRCRNWKSIDRSTRHVVFKRSPTGTGDRIYYTTYNLKSFSALKPKELRASADISAYLWSVVCISGEQLHDLVWPLRITNLPFCIRFVSGWS